MRTASAPVGRVIPFVVSLALVACDAREPARDAGPTPVSSPVLSEASPPASTEASPGTVNPPDATEDRGGPSTASTADDGWPDRSASLFVQFETASGSRMVALVVVRVEGEAVEGGAVDDAPKASAGADSVLRFAPDPRDAPLAPELRVLDRLGREGARAARHLTVEGWRPGVEVLVRLPRELLAREAELLVNGAPFAAEPGARFFDLPLSRDETTVLEWTPAPPGARHD